MFRAGFGMVANYIIGAIGAVILTVIGLGVMDYHRQAMVAGVAPSEFGLSGWTQSFVQRGKDAAQRAQVQARRDGPLNSYFPETVSGWKRFEWNEGFDAMLSAPDPVRQDWEVDFMAELESNPTFKALKAVDAAAGGLRAKSQSQGIAVYIKGSKVAILRARILPSTSSFMGGIAAQISGQSLGGGREKLVKAYSGVGFYQTGYSKNRSGGKTRRLKAKLGEMVEIAVKTNASLPEIDSILRRIDYAKLKVLADIEADESGTEQRDLMADLRRQEMERKRKEADARARIDERLEREKRFARGRDIAEVCITEGGKSYCAWVD